MITESLPHLNQSLFLNKGGFGDVYTDPRDPTRCIKRFKKPRLGVEAHQLLRLIEVAAGARTSELDRLMKSVSWPIEAFGSGNEILGYTMPNAPADSYFSLTVAKRESRALLQTKFLLDSNYWKGAAVTSAQPDLGTSDRLVVAIELHETLSLLHQWGLVYGDVSANNICVRLGRSPGVFLLDADSIVTFDERLAVPVNSPDWAVSGAFDAAQQDRAKFALFVWRLLVEKPFETPTKSAVDGLNSKCGLQLGELILNVYENGDASSFSALATALRTSLDPARRDNAFTEARASGFARRVLACAEIARTPDEIRSVQAAKQQVALETDLDEVRGLRRRVLLRQHAGGRFTLDLLPGSGLVPAPLTAHDLEQLVHAAEFADLATHLATTGLGGLETHPWVERAIHRALAMDAPMVMRVRPGLATSSIEWTWPKSAAVNAAVLIVRSNGREVVSMAQRINDESTCRRDLTLAPNSAVLAQLFAAVQTPTGLVLRSALGSDVHFSTPTPPAPPTPPRRTATQQPAQQHGFSVFDPVAEAARLEALRIAAKRQKIRRLLLASAILLLLAGAGATVKQRYFGTSRSATTSTIRNLQASWSTPLSVLASWDPATGNAGTVIRSYEVFVVFVNSDGHRIFSRLRATTPFIVFAAPPLTAAVNVHVAEIDSKGGLGSFSDVALLAEIVEPTTSQS